MFERYFKWIEKHPFLVMSIFIIFTCFMADQARHLDISASPYILDKEHEARVNSTELKSHFSNTGESVVVALVTEQESIFNPTSLKLIGEKTQKFAALNLTDERDITRLNVLGEAFGLEKTVGNILSDELTLFDRRELIQLNEQLIAKDADQASLDYIADLVLRLKPVKMVRSLATIDDLVSINGDLYVDALMPAPLENPSDIEQLKKQVLSNPMFTNGLLSADGKASRISLELNISEDDTPNMLRVYNAVEALSKPEYKTEHLYISGPPMVTAQTGHVIKSDRKQLLPIVIALVAAVLLLCFRTLRGIFLPLQVAIITMLWTLGCMHLFGYQQNLITAMLPVFLISIAVADAIHVLSAFNLEQKKGLSKTAAMHAALLKLKEPLTLTSLTTIVGFLCLTNTDLTYIKQFGIFVALGVFFALVITLTLIPALFSIRNNKAHKATPSKIINSSEIIPALTNPNLTERVVLHCTRFFSQSKWAFLTVLLVIGTSVSFYLPHLNADNEIIGYFEKDSRIFKDNQAINEHFGTIPLTLWIRSEDANRMKDPEVLVALDRISEELMQLPDVANVLSLSALVKRSEQIINESRYQLPTEITREKISQLLFFHESSRTRQIRDLVDISYKQSRLLISIRSDRASVVNEVITNVNALSAEHLPTDLTFMTTSFGDVLVKSTDEIVTSQTQGMVAAACIILLILSLIYRSVLLGALGLMPLLLTVLLNFVFMVVLDINLNQSTAIISSIALGIGIDYSIHMISHIKRQLSVPDTNLTTAINEAVCQLTKPVLINSLSLAAGFSVLVFSSHQALVNLGWLIATSMIVCAILTLLILPQLLLIFKPKTLWPSAGKQENEDDSAAGQVLTEREQQTPLSS